MPVRWMSIVVLVLAGAVPAQTFCNVEAPSTCTVLGPGHPGGNPPSLLSVLLLPAGGNLVLCYPVPAGGVGGVVVLSVGEPGQPAPIARPLCDPGLIYPLVQLVFTYPPGISNGNTPVLTLPVPPGLRGTGLPVVVQGFSSATPDCWRATAGYVIDL